jgi:hypothetical protein
MTITPELHELRVHECDPPEDATPQRHYWCKSSCPCDDWESKPCRTYGQAARAWRKHHAEDNR